MQVSSRLADASLLVGISAWRARRKLPASRFRRIVDTGTCTNEYAMILRRYSQIAIVGPGTRCVRFLSLERSPQPDVHFL